MNVEDILETGTRVRSEKMEKDRIVGLLDDLLKNNKEIHTGLQANI